MDTYAHVTSQMRDSSAGLIKSKFKGKLLQKQHLKTLWPLIPQGSFYVPKAGLEPARF